jgi:cyclophilin family peptidyl-prolyl cis-trans isomerase
MILFETTLGDFKIEFFEKEAPISVANFQKYIDAHYFDGTIFHRIVPGWRVHRRYDPKEDGATHQERS